MAKRKKGNASRRKSSKSLFEQHKNLKWLLPLLVLVCLGAVIFPKTFTSPSNTTQNQQSNNWNWDYQNGFKIGYPASWKKPSVGNSQGADGKGIEYVYDFRPGPKYFDKNIQPITIPSRTIIEIFIRSDDFTDILQDGSHRGYSTVKSDIDSEILPHTSTTWKNGKTTNTLLYKNEDVYIVLRNNEDPFQSIYLNAYRVVSIPELNISGISLQYQIIHGGGRCPLNQLASNDKEFCITHKIFDEVKRVISSLQPH